MTTQDNRIVVAFNLTHSSYAALDRALRLAQGSPKNVLHFIYVLEPHTDYQQAERVQKQVADVVAQALEARDMKEGVHFFVHARIGKPAPEILMLAQEIGADTIIVGTKGLTGVERMVLGSVAETVVREAGCSVEVARGKTYDSVALLDIKEVEATHKYVPPHRYWYEDHRIEMRPTEWPLY
jgi:nucleotide-binding universal stress UspA family protein